VPTKPHLEGRETRPRECISLCTDETCTGQQKFSGLSVPCPWELLPPASRPLCSTKDLKPGTRNSHFPGAAAIWRACCDRVRAQHSNSKGGPKEPASTGPLAPVPFLSSRCAPFFLLLALTLPPLAVLLLVGVFGVDLLLPGGLGLTGVFGAWRTRALETEAGAPLAGRPCASHSKI